MGQGLLPHHCSFHTFNKHLSSLCSVPGKPDRVLAVTEPRHWEDRKTDVYTKAWGELARQVPWAWGS